MIKTEILLLWVTVGIHVASSVLFSYAFAFQRARTLQPATWLAAGGLLTHSVALGLRWLGTGHGPYLRQYEVYSSDAWVLVAMFLLAQYWRPALRTLGVMIIPVAFLLIGMAVMASPAIRELPVTFTTYWLIIHILFAKLAYGSMLIGASIAVLYLIKQQKIKKEQLTAFYQKLPDPAVLDELSYALIGFGFITLGIMIVAGSIWAKNAWGRYWGWDAVETWSLISWLFYGLYLHLRFTFRWNGARAAWFVLTALVVLGFALFGIGLFYDSFHSPYISG